MEEEAREVYPKLKGTCGQKGIDYQVNLLALFALEGLSLEENWKLSTEHKCAGKFDDIVFQIEGDGDYLMQCKHKESKQTVSRQDFFSTNPNNDFALVRYFDSFLKTRDEFKTELLIICCNIAPRQGDIFKKESTKMTLFRKVGQSYCLNDLSLDDVKKFIMDESNILRILNSNEQAEQLFAEFCAKLKFVHISVEKINGSINDNIADAERTFELRFERHEFMKNIKEWFLEVKGIFVRKSHVKAYLYESHSQKYANDLDKHDIHFERIYNFSDKKIINVISRNANFLNILKIHRSLIDTYENRNILFMNAEDGFKTTEKMIESFELPRYKIMFICLYKINQYSEIYTQLRNILSKYHFKVAVILSQEPIQTDSTETDSLETDLPETDSPETDSPETDSRETNPPETDSPKIYSIRDEINFTNLTEKSQEHLLSKPVIFQGKITTIKQLIGESKDNISSIIDQEAIFYMLFNEKIEIGTAIRDLGDIQNYYIDRTFIFKKDEVLVELKELEMCDLAEKSGKFILISDGAGMGKTTILTRLGCLIKDTYPDLFIIRIDLNMFTSIFEEFVMSNKKSIDLEEILKSKGVDFSKNSFEHNILSMANKIILMVDAVDEISPHYSSLVNNFLMQSSRRKNIFKIFVTTRQHLTQNLESFLDTKSYELQPFSKTEQIRFLTRCWKKNLNIDNDIKRDKCEMYAKTLIDKISNEIGDASWTFIGIPLQTRMIADIFEGSQEKKHGWTGCRDYLKVENDILKLPEKLNITTLYDMFVEKKREIFINDKCNAQGNVITRYILSKQYEDALNEHQKMAALLLFDDHECSLLNIPEYVNNTSRETVIKMGIIQELDNKALFIHQTFAEYFAAKLLWARLKKLHHSKEFLEFLLSTVLVKTEFEVIRAFFENILINESDQIHKQVFQVCGTTVDAIAWDGTKNINVLAREGREHTLKLILENSESSKRGKLLNIVDEGTGSTALISIISNDDSSALRIFYYLLGKGAHPDVRTQRTTTLIAAVLKQNFEMVKELTRRGADTHLKVHDERTALHWAAMKSSVEILDHLLERGTNVNDQDKYGNTAAHYAIKRGKLDFLEKLIDNGADVHIENERGQNLIEYGIFVRAQNLVDFLNVPPIEKHVPYL